jgi:hypothetical protein
MDKATGHSGVFSFYRYLMWLGFEPYSSYRQGANTKPLNLARRNETSTDDVVGVVSWITFTTVDQNSETSLVVEEA